MSRFVPVEPKRGRRGSASRRDCLWSLDSDGQGSYLSVIVLDADSTPPIEEGETKIGERRRRCQEREEAMMIGKEGRMDE